MKARILIVDDQGELRKLVRMTLEYANYELHEAENGARALELVGSVRPTLVVLDVMMPGGMDGLEVCEIIKARPETRNTKVLILSARGQLADLEAGRRAGADGYLVKPFSPLELIEKAEHLLAG